MVEGNSRQLHQLPHAAGERHQVRVRAHAGQPRPFLRVDAQHVHTHRYQDPAAADKIVAIQQDLDDTKAILVPKPYSLTYSRRHVHCAGMDVPVLKMTASPRRSF